MTMVLTPVKLIMKLFLMPVILILTMVTLLAKMVLTLGAYIVGPFMFFVFGCALWTVYKHIWYQTGMLAAIELLTIVLYYGAATVVFVVEDIRDGLLDFVRG